MLETIQRTPVLWALFILQMIIGAAFGVFGEAAGGTLLDTISDPQTARELIAGLSEAQRSAHLWLTVGLDSLYPLAYGGFFAGMALRFYGRFGKWAALPAFGTMIADFAENTIQALALSGMADLLSVKQILTSLKFGLFMVAGVIALIAVGIAVFRLIRSR